MRLTLFSIVCLRLAAQDFTPAREAAIGKAMAEQVRRATTPVEFRQVQDYANRLGARLAAQLGIAGVNYTFMVVSTDQSNAIHEPISLPGGYVFIPSSLIVSANNESEFAGMLAQAMVHKRVLIQSPANAGQTAPQVMLSSETFHGDVSVFGITRRREMELAADKSAVLTMSHAGFDPTALLNYIERVQPPDQVFSAWPPRSARLAALRQAIQEVPAAVYAESGEFPAIQTLFRRSVTRPVSPPSLLK